jgi:hypothetical protein
LRVGVAGLVGLLVLLGPACGDDTGPGEPSPAVELDATATRSSLFDSRRSLRLELRNDGDEAVTVAAVRLDSPLFEPEPASPRETELAPGRQLLVPVPYGASVCDGDHGTSVLDVTVDGRVIAVPLGQAPAHVVDDLHALECAEAAVRQAVDLEFGRDWRPAGERAASGVIEVTPRGEQEATVDSVRGNIVFGVRVPEEVPLVSAPARGGTVRLPLTVVVDRCDPHALIESKRTFQFPVEVRLDGGQPARVVLEAEGPTRDRFQDLIEVCIG